MPSAQKQILKLVTPRPQFGPAGVIVPLAIGGVVIVGGYVFLTRFLKLDWLTEFLKGISPLYKTQKDVADALGLPEPDPVTGQWNNMWNDIINHFAPNPVKDASGATAPKLTVSPSAIVLPSSATITISAVGLLPNKPLYYSFSGFDNGTQYTASSIGTFTHTENAAMLGTTIARYNIAVNQVGWGGKLLQTSIGTTRSRR